MRNLLRAASISSCLLFGLGAAKAFGQDVAIESLDEQFGQTQMTMARLRINNASNGILQNVKASYYLSITNGSTPIIEDYFTPGAELALKDLGNGDFRVDILIESLPPGLFPDNAGLSFGLHDPAWSNWAKDDDYSQPESNTFTTSLTIPVYVDETLVSGTPPTEQAAGPEGLIFSALQPHSSSTTVAGISIKNPTDLAASLDGTLLTDSFENGYAFDNLVLPAGASLKIEIGDDASCADLDFSDFEGCIAASNFPESAWGEFALRANSKILSYVPWGKTGPSANSAIEDGAWESTRDFFTTQNDVVGLVKTYTPGSIFIQREGTRGTSTQDWNLYSETELNIAEQGYLPPASPLSLVDDTIIVVDTPNEELNFTWIPVAGAQSYRLTISDSSNNVVHQEVTAETTSHVGNIGVGAFSWSVDSSPLPASESSLAGASSGVWSPIQSIIDIIIRILASSYPDAVDLSAPQLAARHDTNMLNVKWGDRILSANWDTSHVGVARFDDEESWRCWAVGANILNAYYGGTLSQDEIKYKTKSNPADPILTAFFHSSDGGGSEANITFALNYALNTIETDLNQTAGTPNILQLKSNIANGRPIYFWRKQHIMIIDAYRETAAGDLEFRALNIDNNGSIAWYDLSTQTFVQWWAPNVSGAVRNTDPRIVTDADGDGLVDFDEIERFLTDPNNPDTDGDGVSDKNEIKSYTFRQPYPGNLGLTSEPLSDIDSDGLRPELDWDSDNGGISDGAEDTNFDGMYDAIETDPYEPSDDLTYFGLRIPDGWALYALETLVINDGVDCLANLSGASSCDVASYGTTSEYAVNMGVETVINDIYTRGGTFLRNDSTVLGDVIANDNTVFQDGADVIGMNWDIDSFFGTPENPRLPHFPLHQPLPDYSSPSAELIVQSGQTSTLIDGSAYQKVIVYEGGTLRVSTGEMFIGELHLYHNSNIQFTSPADATTIHVNGFVHWNANVLNSNRSLLASGLTLIQHNNSDITFSSDWSGTVFAPYAKVIVGQAQSKTTYGRVMAKDIEVGAHSTFHYVSQD